MKRSAFIAGGILLASVVFGLTAHPEALNISEFSGLNTDWSPATLSGGQTPDSQNVVTDEGPGLQPRDGFALCAASSATAQWVFPHSNGTRYQIIENGGQLLADSGDCTFATTVSTVASGIRTSGAALGDKFFFTNTTDGLKYWDGTSVTLATTTIAATQLVAHKARLWAAGIAAAPRTVYASKFGDGTNWTLVTDPVVTDPAQYQIGGSVDEPLTTLYASHRDALVWMKPGAFGVITGNSRSDFAVRTYSDNVGTAYPDSVRDCDGLLRFLGPNRTIYEWNGSTLKNIGEQIKGLLSTLAQGDANARTYTLTTQADYQAGTAYQMTTEITAGSIQLSTWTDTDSTTDDFSLFTSSSNVEIRNNSVYLSTNNTNINNYGFEDGTTASNSLNWVGWDGSGFRPYNSGHSGSWSARAISPAGYEHVWIVDMSNSILIYTTHSFTTSWEQKSISLAGLENKYIKIVLDKPSNDTPSATALFSEPFICSGDSIYWYTKQEGSLGILYDDFSYGRSNIYSGYLTSRVFDTAFSSSAWLSSDAGWTANGNSVSIQTETSYDGVTWESPVTWSTGSAPSSSASRYIRYTATLSTGGTTSGTALPHLDDVTFSARSNYGAFTTSAIPTGSPSSWGAFGVDTDLDNGAVAYAVYTDTDTAMTITSGIPTAGYVSSMTITDAASITLSTAPYLRVGETFSIDAATQTPINNSLTINWNEGVTTKSPSAWFRGRYWIGAAVNSPTNNRILVFDKKRQWQLYSGINASTLGIYNGSLFFGNSAGVYQYEVGNDDAGTDIEAYYRTATFSPSGPNLISTFNDLTFTTDYAADSLSTTFQVNGDTGTDYALADVVMNAVAGIQSRRLAFPFSQVQQGRNISLKFSVTGSEFWRVLGASLDFTPGVVPE